MEEKSKIIVFEKKEIALIFSCIILIAVTSFTLGVKLGKSFVLQKQGIKEADIKTVQLKSAEEEWVEGLAKSEKKIPAGHTAPAQHGDDPHAVVNEAATGHGEAHDRPEGATTLAQKSLEAEFGQLDHELKKDDPEKSLGAARKDSVELQSHAPMAAEQAVAKKNQVIAAPEAEVKEPPPVQRKDNYFGKHTIQLGSYQTEDEATKFADGFKVRGYDPIIQEVHLTGKGVWYRVSLGIFSSVAEAKDYIEKEESLFHGQDYVIAEFQ